MIMLPPSSNGSNGDGKNGRKQNGQFDKGHKFAKGNPLAKRYFAFRKKMLSAVTEDELGQIVESMVRKAIEGDAVAAKIILDRCVGPVEKIIELSMPDGDSGGVHIYLPDNGRSDPMIVDEFA